MITAPNTSVYPIQIDTSGKLYISEFGINIRQYYAGQALAAMGGMHARLDPDEVAKLCWAVADAMLRNE